LPGFGSFVDLRKRNLATSGRQPQRGIVRPQSESAKKKLATSVGSRSAALAARRISLLAECASRARMGDRTG
jgi:hypothetical protein